MSVLISTGISTSVCPTLWESTGVCPVYCVAQHVGSRQCVATLVGVCALKVDVLPMYGVCVCTSVHNCSGMYGCSIHG